MFDKEGDSMYILNRLEKMCLEEVNDIKRILSTYFLRNADKPITLQKCIKDTGVSKSAIYTFFSETGFKSFKGFLKAIYEEVALLEYYSKNQNYDFHKDFHFVEPLIFNLIEKIRKADNIYFYGNQKEINLFQDTMLFLIRKGYNVKILNIWNVNVANDMLDTLKSNDVFIIVDTNYRLNVFYDVGAVNPNIIDLDKVNYGEYHKFYIGKKNIEENSTQIGFGIIYMDKKLETVPNIGLLLLDKYIASLLKERVG